MRSTKTKARRDTGYWDWAPHHRRKSDELDAHQQITEAIETLYDERIDVDLLEYDYAEAQLAGRA